MENRETLNLIDNEKNNNKWSLKKKICIGILIGILIILITIIIIVIVSVNNLKEILKKAGYDEPWNDLYGNKTINIPYFKDNKIINTFKKNGKNYKEEIGDINNGNDYEKNVRNY
jgi:DNA-binding XRE family transcriptional regulator